MPGWRSWAGWPMSPNTGDHGSSDVRAPSVVTPLAGLRAALPDVEITTPDGDDAEAAAAAAAGADAAIVVVGYTAEDEGEYVGSFDPKLAALYPPSADPNALADLARVWDEGPQARRRRPRLAAAASRGRGADPGGRPRRIRVRSSSSWPEPPS